MHVYRLTRHECHINQDPVNSWFVTERVGSCWRSFEVHGSALFESPSAFWERQNTVTFILTTAMKFSRRSSRVPPWLIVSSCEGHWHVFRNRTVDSSGSPGLSFQDKIYNQSSTSRGENRPLRTHAAFQNNLGAGRRNLRVSGGRPIDGKLTRQRRNESRFWSSYQNPIRPLTSTSSVNQRINGHEQSSAHFEKLQF